MSLTYTCLVLLADIVSASIAWNPETGDSVVLGAVEADIPFVEAIAAHLPAKARGRIFLEVKARPLYFIDEVVRASEPSAGAREAQA